MSICIRSGDVVEDRVLLIDLLFRNLPRGTDGVIFDWLYLANPQGPARFWLAKDSNNAATIGAAAAFPRHLYIDSRETECWVLGDFCLDTEYRSLGPALQLQRACLGVMDSDGGAFCYDFPSASMVAVYKRLGFGVSGKMLRLARLLHVDRKVRELVGLPAARSVVSAVGNTLLKYTLRKFVPDESVKIAPEQGPCGEEFSILARQQQGRLGIFIQRSAEYLNWRYLNNPLAKHHFLTARRDGCLKGFLVWTQGEEDAYVVDLFGENDPAIIKGLLAEVCARLSKSGVVTVSLWLNESHPWLSWCSDMGFQVRESAPVMFIPAVPLAKSADLGSGHWFLTQGDRDS